MRKFISFVLLLAFFLSACSANPTPIPQPGTAAPEVPPEQTGQTDVTAAPLATLPAETTAPDPAVEIEPEAPIAGIQIHHLRQEDLQAFSATGSTWTRYDGFHWNEIEPVQSDPPAYQWEAVDDAGLQLAAETGMEIIGLVLFAPPWAQKYPGAACGPIAEAALDRFGSFIEALVARYSQPPYNIHYWELGNEPDVAREFVPGDNIFGCWGETTDEYYGGGYYAEMLKVVYPRIKAADPEAQVLVGGLLLDCDPVNPPADQNAPGGVKDCTSGRFLEGILRAGGGDFFDGVSFHAYDYYMGALGTYSNGNWHSLTETTGPVLHAKADYLKGLLEQYGYADKFLLNSEVALICGRDGKEPECVADTFERTKAFYVVQSYVSAVVEGLRANIWYSLNSAWRASDLVASGFAPRPAYTAYQVVIDRLEGAALTGELTQFPGVRGYEFHRGDQRLWVLWSLDGGEHMVELPAQPQAVYDVFGEPVPATGQTQQVTLSPVYVELAP